MSSPEILTTNAFDNAKTYTDDAMALATSFLADFAANLYTAPLVDVIFPTITAPVVVAIPDVPTFDTPTFDMPATPSALVIDAPDIVVSEFTDVAPAVDLSAMPVFDFGVKPSIVIGDAPAVYEVVVPSVPDAPILDDVTAPTLLTLTTPTFAGVDVHDSFLSAITGDVPVLSLAEPTAYTYTPGVAYTSALKTAISAALVSRLAGGTGLPAGVEAAIWGRSSDRESAQTQAAIDDATAANEALGWSLPTGATAAAVRKARQNQRNRSGDFAREVGIKQAEMEQKNILDALEQGVKWEGQLIDYSLNLEKITFESAKVTAENAIAIHNAGLERFRALMQAIQIRAGLFDTIIKAEGLKIEELKADIALEQAKADINKSLVADYMAQIEARMAVVKVYELRLDTAKTLMELEKLKVEASAEAIRGFTAGVNAKTATLEVYKVGVAAEQIKGEAWKTNVQGQLAGVQAFQASAEAFKAKSGAEAVKSNALIERFRALWSAKEAEFRGFSAQTEAQRAKVMSFSDIARSMLAAYEANTRSIEVTANQNARLFEARVKQSEAQASYTQNGQKINSDIIAANRQVLLDASKAGAQIIAQIAGSAMGQAHAQASIQGHSGTTVAYQYGGDVNASVDPATAVQIAPTITA